MSLQDKVAIVTGASSGIGEAIARDLSTAGMKLVVTARREERLAALCDALPGEATYVAAAIEDVETPQHLLDHALQTFGRADVLINNAGILIAGPMDSIDLDDLGLMTRVNFDAPVRASYILGRHFKKQGSGAIINISSIGAYMTHASMGVYSGLKHALEVFTTALRVELKGSGVRVGSIAPGTTDTEIFDRLRAQGQTVGADKNPALDPIDVALSVRFALEQPERANMARMLLVSSSEMA